MMREICACKHEGVRRAVASASHIQYTRVEFASALGGVKVDYGALRASARRCLPHPRAHMRSHPTPRPPWKDTFVFRARKRREMTFRPLWSPFSYATKRRPRRTALNATIIFNATRTSLRLSRLNRENME
jgi:hypothetical protein